MTDKMLFSLSIFLAGLGAGIALTALVAPRSRNAPGRPIGRKSEDDLPAVAKWPPNCSALVELARRTFQTFPLLQLLKRKKEWAPATARLREPEFRLLVTAHFPFS